MEEKLPRWVTPWPADSHRPRRGPAPAAPVGDDRGASDPESSSGQGRVSGAVAPVGDNFVRTA